jgi:IclR family KDG regulon transcriptional repressor
MSTKNNNESSVRALDKALNILELMTTLEGDVDLATLARKTRMPKSTLLRLLNTLKKHHFVHQDSQSRRFSLSWALIYMGRAAQRSFSLISRIHPFLEKLHEATGETANLAIREGHHAVYVDQVISSNLVKAIPPIGTPLGLYCTAAGKMLLSGLSDKELGDFLDGAELVKKTAKTITRRDILGDEVAKIRRLGYALDNEETEVGGRCVAGPVYSNEGKLVAVISVVGPASRLKMGALGHLAEVVRQLSAEASRALGYNTDQENKVERAG